MEKLKETMAKESWVSVAIATVLLAVVLSFMSPAFLQISNFKNIIVQSSITGIMAVGMSFIIMTAGIDISVGAILFFTGSLFAQMLQAGIGAVPAMLLTLLAATALGALNGILIVKMKMTPFITTLATYNVYRGAALHITKAGNIPVAKEVRFLGTGEIAGIPVPILLFIVIVLIGAYLLKYTKFGTYAKALGNSEKSATETGLPVGKVTIAVYMLGGLTAGLSGLILISRIGGLQSGMGIGMEFSVIAAVVLGGTKLSGGEGSMLGSVLGAIFLVLIENGLNLIQASSFIYDVVKGVVLLIAVFVDRVSLERQVKSLQEQKRKRIRGNA
ncbi:MAG: ABC transporter permease [Bacillota bacterium]